MADKSTQDMLRRYAGYQPGSKRETDTYEAWSLGRPHEAVKRLDVRMRKAQGQIVNYGYVTRIIYTADQLITLGCTDCTVTIEGTGLEPLRELLQDERVRWLQEFDRERHKEPDDNAPVIRSIVIKNLFEGNG